MKVQKLNTILVVLALTIAGGCSEQSDAPDSSAPVVATAPALNIDGYTVLETFDVGEGVYVRSLALEPKQQGLWVGTSIGVLEVDTQTRDMKGSYTRESGLANEYVFGMLVDSTDAKWFGTNGGGVSKLSNGEWTTFFPMHGLADYWIYSFVEGLDNRIWIGTWNGLNVYDPSDRSLKTYLKELVNEWVYGLGVDSKGTVWIGTEGGVNAFDGKTWSTWTHEDGLGAPNLASLPISDNTGLGTRSRHDLSVMNMGRETYNPNYVFTLMVDRNDGVWAGTWGGGLAHYNGQKWVNFTDDEGMAGNVVYSIAESPNGDIWAGTNKGVSKFDGKKWQTLNQGGGLLENNVYAIAIEENGNVWLGTHRGVTLLGKN